MGSHSFPFCDLQSTCSMIHYGEKFQSGLGYHDFLHVHGTEDQRRRWQGVHEQIALTDAQRKAMKVLIADVRRKYGQIPVTTHAKVSPGRKNDPDHVPGFVLADYE